MNRAERSDEQDAWLAGLVPDGAPVALAAVGALGRRELAPHSDLDLVLLHERRDVTAVADAIWYPIWDSGTRLDHSVRTHAEALAVARQDAKALLGLLELRHIAGDALLTARLRKEILALWRGTAARRAAQLRELAAQRHARSGDAAFLLEPNLKDSRGGLRDGQLLHALALAQLLDLPASVRREYALLLDLRDELQLHSGRAEDVLRREDQAAVARRLGLGDADDALRAVNAAARVIGHHLERAWRRVPPARHAPRFGLAPDVVVHDGEVVLSRDARPRADPGLALRAARAAAEHDLPLGEFTLQRLAVETPAPGEPWPEQARADFLALLGAGPAAVPVLESLDLAGLLARYLPEWDAVRYLAQHNPVHRYTVDRHLLETAAQAAALQHTVERPDLLLIAALLHDLGKGRAGDHAAVGAELAAGVVARMGFPAADVATVAALVRHHLLLPHTATRRDPDDPATLRIVRAAVGESGELLDLLHALAIADAAATGPAAWTDWRAGLVADLVRRVHAGLRGAAPARPVPLDDECLALARAGRLAVLVRDGEVVIAAPDRVGVLYRSVGVLALHLLDVRSAAIAVDDGMAVNRFAVLPRFGRLPDPARLRADLARYLGGDPGLAAHLRAKEQAYPQRQPGPVSVLWFDDEATGATVLEYRGPDTIGLLCRITAAIERCQLDVRAARIASLGGAVVDAFYVTTRDGDGVPALRRPEIESELRLASGPRA